MSLPYNAAYGGAFALQRPILSPIGQLLSGEGALRYGITLLLLKHAEHSAELATFGGSPLSGFAGLSPRESVSHDSQVALLPYESCSLATPSGGQNRPLYTPL